MDGVSASPVCIFLTRFDKKDMAKWALGIGFLFFLIHGSNRGEYQKEKTKTNSTLSSHVDVLFPWGSSTRHTLLPPSRVHPPHAAGWSTKSKKTQ